MDHVLVSFHSQASPTLSTFLFSNTKNRRFRRKVTKAPALAKASMLLIQSSLHSVFRIFLNEDVQNTDLKIVLLPKKQKKIPQE